MKLQLKLELACWSNGQNQHLILSNKLLCLGYNSDITMNFSQSLGYKAEVSLIRLFGVEMLKRAFCFQVLPILNNGIASALS